MSKFLFLLLGFFIYTAVICVDLPNKTWKQISFSLAFFCFVGSFMTGESERIVDEILSDEEDILIQSQMDSAFEDSHSKNLKPATTLQISSNQDFPPIPFTWG
jgi:hypothetical protein